MIRSLTPFIKIGLFYLLKYAYKVFSPIEPIRRKILGPLKRANQWLANYDTLQGRAKVRNFPVEVIFQATWRCNLVCPMCFRQFWPKDVLAEMNTKNMELDMFRKISDQILPYATKVNLSATGEPLLVPNLKEIIKVISHYGCKLEIYTNVTPLQSDKLMDLILPHVGELRASIDGATKETFEKIREGGNFEKVVKALERFGEKRKELPDPKPVYGFFTSIQKDNVNELADIVALAASVGAESVIGDHILEYGERNRELSVADKPEIYAPAYEKAKKVAAEKGISFDFRPPVSLITPSPHAEKIDQGDKPEQKGICNFWWKRLYIDFNGRAIACCHPKPPEYGFGIENDFWKVWASPTAQNFRKNYQNSKGHPSCKNCYLLVGPNGDLINPAPKLDMEESFEKDIKEMEEKFKQEK